MTNESFIKVNNKLVLVNGHPITINGSSSNLQENKAVTITANGTATITPDEGYDGLSSVDVTVNVSGGGGVENESCEVTLQGYFQDGSFFAFTRLVQTPFSGWEIKPTVIYITENFSGDNFVVFDALKNSSFFIGGITGDCVAEGSVVAGTSNQDGYYSFWVTGDCQITFQ